jgi:hypothetical protein
MVRFEILSKHLKLLFLKNWVPAVDIMLEVHQYQLDNMLSNGPKFDY